MLPYAEVFARLALSSRTNTVKPYRGGARLVVNDPSAAKASEFFELPRGGSRF